MQILKRRLKRYRELIDAGNLNAATRRMINYEREIHISSALSH